MCMNSVKETKEKAVEANAVTEEVEVEAMEDEVIMEKKVIEAWLKGVEEVDKTEMVGAEEPALAETRNKAAVKVGPPEELLMTTK